MSSRITNKILGSAEFGFEDDERYQPWRTCQAGEVMHIELKMQDGSSEFFSYMQKFTMTLNEQHTLLTLESGNETVKIEGRELHQLARATTQRQVRSVHLFDEQKYEEQPQEKALVTAITSEISS